MKNFSFIFIIFATFIWIEALGGIASGGSSGARTSSSSSSGSRTSSSNSARSFSGSSISKPSGISSSGSKSSPLSSGSRINGKVLKKPLGSRSMLSSLKTGVGSIATGRIRPAGTIHSNTHVGGIRSHGSRNKSTTFPRQNVTAKKIV